MNATAVPLPQQLLGRMSKVLGSRFQGIHLSHRIADAGDTRRGGYEEAQAKEEKIRSSTVDGALTGPRIAGCAAFLAHLQPQDAITRIVEMAAEFQAGTPLQDDMTLLVLQSRD